MEIDRLFQKYYRPLCLYASRFLTDADRVEDIVQGAFVSLWEMHRAGRVPEWPKAYLYRIVHNRCIDDIRRTGKGSQIDVSSLVEDVPDEEAVERSFVWARLWTAIDGLPERRRQILLMNKRDGITCQEIARRMGISENTVHNQLAKALKTLRDGASKIIHFVFCL